MPKLTAASYEPLDVRPRTSSQYDALEMSWEKSSRMDKKGQESRRLEVGTGLRLVACSQCVWMTVVAGADGRLG